MSYKTITLLGYDYRPIFTVYDGATISVNGRPVQIKVVNSSTFEDEWGMLWNTCYFADYCRQNNIDLQVEDIYLFKEGGVRV